MQKISIIVLCYNQAQYLDECLQSVLDQAYQEWECIIINDGSTDYTEGVVEKWLLKDPRFHYFYQSNKGVSAARNYAVENSAGEWILPLDGDDFVDPDYLSEASRYFDEDCKVIYGNALKFGDVNEVWILPEYTKEKMALFNIIHNSALYRKEDFIKIGGYDSKLMHGLEDWEFWINLLKDGGNVKHLPGIYLNYRVKKKSRQTDMDYKKTEAMIQYIESKHIGFYHNTFGTFHNLVKQNLDLQSKVNGRVYRFYTLLANLFRKN